MWFVAIAGVIVIAGAAAICIWHVSRTLHTAKEEVRAEHELQVVIRPYNPETQTRFEPINSPAVYVEATQFQDHFFVVGPAGLLEYDMRGSLRKQYAAGRDLPSSPLIAVAVGVLGDSHEAELLIATADDGILAFNGQSFRQIFPENADVRAITSILPTAAGHLLIGTKKRGVLLYDGRQLVPLHSTLKDLYVTALAGSEPDLWIGTIDRGVAHYHAGQTDWFAEQDGLPDSQVLSLAIECGRTYVGTAMGVAVFDDGKFSRTLGRGVLATSLLAAQEQLFVGTEDEGILDVPLRGRSNTRSGTSAVSLERTGELLEVKQIFKSDESVFVLTRNGLYRMGRRDVGWQSVLQTDAAVLTDRNISALAADESGRMWVGYFDRGLDVIDSNGARARHIEDEHVFCVNRILRDPQSGNVDVATANGLIRFDADANQQQLLTHADGLIADHVTDVAFYRGGLALATPAGLTFLDSSGARSMYAFHGLVNNRVYALAVSGDELVAGTLGGLSVLDKGAVQVNYTTASGLAHNWITSVVAVDDGWMVGTYGAGVLALDHSGHFHRFSKTDEGYEVNPNAMLVTHHHVFAGSLGKGLYVYERESGRWFAITRGLPSLNVTALALSHDYLYVGTDNGLVRIPEQELHP